MAVIRFWTDELQKLLISAFSYKSATCNSWEAKGDLHGLSNLIYRKIDITLCKIYENRLTSTTTTQAWILLKKISYKSKFRDIYSICIPVLTLNTNAPS